MFNILLPITLVNKLHQLEVEESVTNLHAA